MQTTQIVWAWAKSETQKNGSFIVTEDTAHHTAGGIRHGGILVRNDHDCRWKLREQCLQRNECVCASCVAVAPPHAVQATGLDELLRYSILVRAVQIPARTTGDRLCWNLLLGIALCGCGGGSVVFRAVLTVIVVLCRRVVFATVRCLLVTILILSAQGFRVQRRGDAHACDPQPTSPSVLFLTGRQVDETVCWGGDRRRFPLLLLELNL
jgi:hypothetical protein